jgi:hypothetical protein
MRLLVTQLNEGAVITEIALGPLFHVLIASYRLHR